MMQVLARLSLAALALLMFALLPAPARAAESCSGEFVTYYLCGGDGVEETICDSGDPGARPVEETVTWSCPVACGNGLRECRVYRDCDGDTWGADLVVNVGSCSSATRGGDCDDQRASVNPGIREEHSANNCLDGRDNNCDGVVDRNLVDVDKDTFFDDLCTPGTPQGEDCDDRNSITYPGAPETCNGEDNDCSLGPDIQNQDGDPAVYYACVEDRGPDHDCDDQSAVSSSRFPGNPEVCDGIDNDCDEAVDSQDWDEDDFPYLPCPADASSPVNDCLDSNRDVNPGQNACAVGSFDNCQIATLGAGQCDRNCNGLLPDEEAAFEICGDGIDNDCNSGPNPRTPDDTDTTSVDEFEFVPETCDVSAENPLGIDQNCDGVLDLGEYDANSDLWNGGHLEDFDGDGISRPICDEQADYRYDCVDVLFDKSADTTPDQSDPSLWVFENGELPGQCRAEWTPAQCANAHLIHPGMPENCVWEDTDCDGFPDTVTGCDDIDNDCDGNPYDTDDWDNDSVFGIGCDGQPLDSDETSSVCGSVPLDPAEYYTAAASLVDVDGQPGPDCSENCIDRDDDGVCTVEEQACENRLAIDGADLSSVRLFSEVRLFPTSQCEGNTHTPIPNPSVSPNVFLEVPATIELEVGECGSGSWSDLLFENPINSVSCRYACEGGARYEFLYCDDGVSLVGSEVYTTQISLDTNTDITAGASIAYAELYKRTRACDVTQGDDDGDGHYPPGACAFPADDCDDADGSRVYNCDCVDYSFEEREQFAALPDGCDYNDNDCDGEIDEGTRVEFYVDSDGDGFGEPVACDADCPRILEPGSGFIASDDQYNAPGTSFQGVDCNDQVAGQGCGTCVGDNCAGCTDADGDGWPADCLRDGKVDCDDSDPFKHPAAAEICDGIDNDCDCSVDEETIDSGMPCTEGEGACATPGDTICRAGELLCLTNTVSPAADVDEICGDGIDNNCRDGVDEGCGDDWCADADRQENSSLACLPLGYAAGADGPLAVLEGGLEPLRGELSVNELGAATYSLPIVVPPGRRGMQPALSINYNSQLSEGLESFLGPGFTLSGVPAVERCSTSTAIDGWRRAPEFNDETDAWCIDGQRLLRGGDNVFFVHNAPFEPMAWSGSNGFTWTRKDGSTWHFSNAELSGSTPWRWRLTEVVDVHGNSVEYGAYRGRVPTTIQYGKSSSGHAHSRRIQLDITDTDKPAGYRFGEIRSRGQLASIAVNLGEEEVRRYVFSYAEGRLQSIAEQAGGVERAVRFGWEGHAGRYRSINAQVPGQRVPAPPGAGLLAVADIDGDGIPEVSPGFVLEDDQVRLRYAKLNTDETFTRREGPWLDEDVEPHPKDCESDDYDRCNPENNGDWGRFLLRQWFDFDQDGKAEYLAGQRKDDRFHVFNVGANDETSLRPVYWNWRDFTRSWMGDFDGDGVFEIVTADEDERLHTVNPGICLPGICGMNPVDYPGRVSLVEQFSMIGGDFDGDGIAELRTTEVIGGRGARITSLNRVEANPFEASPNQDPATRWASGDLNGDGYSDVGDCSFLKFTLGVGQPGQSFGETKRFWRSFGEVGQSFAPTVGDSFCATADYDGDGDAEFFVRSDNSVRVFDLRMVAGQIEGAEIPEWRIDFPYEYEPMDFVLADLDGDGDSDLYLHNFEGSGPRGPQVYVKESTSYRIKQVFEHQGSVTPEHEITYSSIHNPVIYTPSPNEGACDQDKVCHPPTVDVVAAVVSGTSAGVPETRRYTYGHALSARDGSFSGFRFRTVEEEVADRFRRYERNDEPMKVPASSSVAGYWEASLNTREFEVYNTGSDTDTVVMVTTRAPNTVEIPIPDGERNGIFTYVEKTEQNTFEDPRAFAVVRDELRAGTYEVPSGDGFRTTISEMQYDSYGNATVSQTTERVGLSGFDSSSLEDGFADRVAIESAGVTTRITRSFASDASVSVRRRGLFSTVVEDTTNTLCNYLRSGGTDVPVELSSCPSGSETTTVAKLTYWPSGDVRTRSEGVNALPLVEARYEYSAEGNVVRTELVDLSGEEPPRVAAVSYDGEAIFPHVSTNALGHQTLTAYDRRFGAVIYQQDPDGVAQSHSYDDFGRLRRSHSPNRVQRTEFGDASGLNDPRAVRSIETYLDDEGEPRSRTELDRFGRTVRSESRMFDGAYTFQTFWFDEDGRSVRSSTPSQGTPDHEYSQIFDSLGRLVSKETEFGTLNYAYVGPEMRISGVRGASYLVGAGGNTVAVRHDSAPDSTITYYHTSTGQVLHVRSELSNTEMLHAEFDVFGRNTAQSVGGNGKTTYVYNAFGEVKSQTDAAGRSVANRYDALGRVSLTSGKSTAASVFSYDSSSGRSGIGGLAKSVSQDGHEISHDYDEQGRVRVERHARDGEGAYSHEYEYRYDELGRLKRQAMPTVSGFGRYSVCYTFDAIDQVDSMVLELDADLSSTACQSGPAAKTLMDVSTRDEQGRVTQVLYGSGRMMDYAFSHDPDSYGALDHVRLHGGGGAERMVMTTWNEGRVTSKTFVHGVTETQTFDYVNEQLEGVAGAHTKTYGVPSEFGVNENTPRGEAIVSSSFRPESTSSELLAWDEAGYLESTGRYALKFDDYGRPVEVVPNGDAPTRFSYDSSGQRVAIESGTDRLVRAGNYSVQTGGSGAVHRFNLGFAIVTVSDGGGGGLTPTIEYLLDDQVGSTLLRESSPGSTPMMSALSPYGGETAAPAPGVPGMLVEPSFAGHDSLVGAAGLVDMGARFYDPTLGVFVSPDPVVQDVHRPLAYNPYVYVYNDPASLTDPTGESVLVTAAVAAGIGALQTYVNSNGHAGFKQLSASAAQSAAIAVATQGVFYAIGEVIGSFSGVTAKKATVVGGSREAITSTSKASSKASFACIKAAGGCLTRGYGTNSHWVSTPLRSAPQISETSSLLGVAASQGGERYKNIMLTDANGRAIESTALTSAQRKTARLLDKTVSEFQQLLPKASQSKDPLVSEAARDLLTRKTRWVYSLRSVDDHVGGSRWAQADLRTNTVTVYREFTLFNPGQNFVEKVGPLQRVDREYPLRSGITAFRRIVAHEAFHLTNIDRTLNVRAHGPHANLFERAFVKLW